MRIQTFGDETKPKLLADGAGMVQLTGHLHIYLKEKGWL